MAGRPQRRAVYGPNCPRAGVRPVYEDFKPNTEWKHEEQSDILLIQLPGFAKEHLKVSMEGTATLRIHGERLVGGNRWSRFEEVVIIPEDCIRTGIRAKYEHGVLTITMPKTHKNSPVVPLPNPKQETEAKPTTTTTLQEALAARETSDDEKPEKGKSLADQSISDQKRKVDAQKSLSEHFSSEQEKATVTSEPLPKSVEEAALTDTKATEPENVGNGVVSATPAGIISGFKFNKYMQAVKDKLPKRTELNEERQLMVNVGTAVLVIVGLGAYISYATGLSG